MYTNKLLSLLALCTFLVGLDSMITVPLLPAMVDAGRIPMNLGVLLVTAYALAYMITAPIFGVVSDRRGRKQLIQWGIVILGAGTLLTGFGNGLTPLLVFRAITGMGAGILQPAVLAMISDLFPYDRRGRAIGIVMSALTGSNLLGVPIAAWMAGAFGWQWTFWGVSALALVILLAVSAGVPKDAKQAMARMEVGSRSGGIRQSLQLAFSNRMVIFALLATLLWFAGMQGMFANIGMFYDHKFGLSVNKIGLVMMMAGSCNMIGSILGGKLADQLGKQTVVSIAAILCAIGVLSFSLLVTNMLGAIAVHVIWSMAFGLGHAAMTAFVSELQPAIRGTVLSLNSSAMYAGMTGATGISALLLQTGSFWTVGIMCAVFCLAVFPIIRALHPVHSEKRDAAVLKQV